MIHIKMRTAPTVPPTLPQKKPAVRSRRLIPAASALLDSTAVFPNPVIPRAKNAGRKWRGRGDNKINAPPGRASKRQPAPMCRIREAEDVAGKEGRF